MTRDSRDAHEDQHEDFDPEGPDPSEMDSSDDPDLEVCPHCRKLISEEADRCPHCGEYITPSEAPMSTGAWIVVFIIIGLVVLGLVRLLI